MIDPHRAEDDIRETIDISALAQVIDKELTETTPAAQRPAIKIDSRNNGLWIDFLHSLFAIKFGLRIHALRIRFVRFGICIFFCAIEDRIRGEVDEFYISFCTGFCQFARQVCV